MYPISYRTSSRQPSGLGEREQLAGVLDDGLLRNGPPPALRIRMACPILALMAPRQTKITWKEPARGPGRVKKTRYK